jgi:hypothetical protein
LAYGAFFAQRTRDRYALLGRHDAENPDVVRLLLETECTYVRAGIGLCRYNSKSGQQSRPKPLHDALTSARCARWSKFARLKICASAGPERCQRNHAYMGTVIKNEKPNLRFNAIAQRAETENVRLLVGVIRNNEPSFLECPAKFDKEQMRAICVELVRRLYESLHFVSSVALCGVSRLGGPHRASVGSLRSHWPRPKRQSVLIALILMTTIVIAFAIMTMTESGRVWVTRTVSAIAGLRRSRDANGSARLVGATDKGF